MLKEKWTKCSRDTRELILLFIAVMITMFIIYPIGIKAATGSYPKLFSFPSIGNDIKTEADTTINLDNTKSNITSSNILMDGGRVQTIITYANGKSYSQIYGINNIPIITSEIMTEWVLKKGNELISMMQSIMQPITIVVFIIGAGMALVGTISKSGLMNSGLICMALSPVLYLLILYSPLILNLLPSLISS